MTLVTYVLLPGRFLPGERIDEEKNYFKVITLLPPGTPREKTGTIVHVFDLWSRGPRTDFHHTEPPLHPPYAKSREKRVDSPETSNLGPDPPDGLTLLPPITPRTSPNGARI